jgi:hypothetical protein
METYLKFPGVPPRWTIADLLHWTFMLFQTGRDS